MTKVQLDEVINQIKSPCLVATQKNTDNEYTFTLKRRRLNWNVKLIFQANFPFSLPSAYLQNINLIGLIPHVNFEGLICVSESDSLLWDYSQPVSVLEYLLCKIVKLLDDASLKDSVVELTDEYEGYFQCISSSVNSFYEAKNILEHAYLKVVQTNDKKVQAKPVLLSHKRNQHNESYSNLDTDKSQVINIIHIPLIEAVLPPKNRAEISPEYIFNLQKLLSLKNKKKLDMLLAKEKSHTQFFVLISMPRTTGERTQLLLNFTTKKAMEHPLLKLSENWNVELFLLSRHSKSYLLERGGAANGLSNKKVAIVGCGSVGGEVALMLAKLGVGELTLIDYDLLSGDNIYRHRLGGLSLNYAPDKKTGKVKRTSKVTALASMLELDLPYIKVNQKPQGVFTVIKDSSLLASDLVIVAVGSPILNLEINRRLKGIGLNNVIFCWNEADGIGGHSVLLDLKESCLECLFTNDEGYNNRCQLSLLERGQEVSKNLTGCAGTFTPFSYLDSSQTALLACKQAVNHLLFGEHSKATSWKGDNHSSLKVSRRYEKMSLKEEIELRRSASCGACRE